MNDNRSELPEYLFLYVFPLSIYTQGRVMKETDKVEEQRRTVGVEKRELGQKEKRKAQQREGEKF